MKKFILSAIYCLGFSAVATSCGSIPNSMYPLSNVVGTAVDVLTGNTGTYPTTGGVYTPTRTTTSYPTASPNPSKERGVLTSSPTASPLPSEGSGEASGTMDIYYEGRRVGDVRSNGDVYINGRRAGEIRSNGDIYVDGRRTGEIRSNGDVYKNGRRVGEIRSNGDIYEEGRRVGEVRSSGDIYKEGRRIGEARNMRNRTWAAVIYFYAFFSI